MEKIRLSFK